MFLNPRWPQISKWLPFYLERACCYVHTYYCYVFLEQQGHGKNEFVQQANIPGLIPWIVSMDPYSITG